MSDMFRFAEDGLAIFRQGREVKLVPEESVEILLPCIILHLPKYPHNVGQVVRLASCYGVRQILYSGDRVQLDVESGKHFRLPREERMRGYADVQLVQCVDPIRVLPREAVPVAVEVRPNSERLPAFRHPANAAYIFGPEDGGLPGSVLKRCHKFVTIETKHCLNLATAVGTVLYDRSAYNDDAKEMVSWG